MDSVRKRKELTGKEKEFIANDESTINLSILILKYLKSLIIMWLSL